MNNERTDRMVDILAEEWDSYVVLASRVEDGNTIYFHARVGNQFAIEKMLENELDDMKYGSPEEGYGEEEEAKN